MSGWALIFEAEAAASARLAGCAERAGLVGDVANMNQAAFSQVQQQPQAWSLIVLGSGIAADQFAALVAAQKPDMALPPIMALSEEPGRSKELYRLGAAEVLPAAAGEAALSAAMRRTSEVGRLKSDFSRIKGYPDAELRLNDLRGASHDMERAVALAERAARMQMHVLLEGEAGVGKQLMARAIHAASARASRPFVEADLSAMACNDAERTLFDKRDGLFWRARGGTLFIRNIQLLPLAAQSRLARMVGPPDNDVRDARATAKPSVRLVAGTRGDLLKRVKAGQFRDDLFYQLNICPILIPPLRRRRDDVPALAQRLMQAFALETGRRIETLSAEAAELLSHHDWQGNLFELEREVFRAMLMAEQDMLTAHHFPRLQQSLSRATPGDCSYPARRGPASSEVGEATTAALVEGMPAAPLAGHVRENLAVGIPALTARGEIRSLDDVEADMIRLAIGRYRGSMTEAARRLGIGRSTLYRKIREFGLDGQGSRR